MAPVGYCVARATQQIRPPHTLMAGKQSRREPRIDLDLSVTLLLPDGEVEYPVGDASYRGVFLVSDNPLPLRKLVRFRTQLGEDENPLQMMGLVAHHISPGEAAEIGRDPGMGIHLFSVGEETHRRWRQFIRQRYETHPDAREQFKRLEYPHVVAHLPSNQALEEFFDDELANGEMFVRSSEIHEEGENVIVDIVHPDGNESLDLEGRVQKAVKSPPRKRGMTILFEDLDREARHRLQAFIDGDFEALNEGPPPEEEADATEDGEQEEQPESDDAAETEDAAETDDETTAEETSEPAEEPTT